MGADERSKTLLQESCGTSGSEIFCSLPEVGQHLLGGAHANVDSIEEKIRYRCAAFWCGSDRRQLQVADFCLDWPDDFEWRWRFRIQKSIFMTWHESCCDKANFRYTRID